MSSAERYQWKDIPGSSHDLLLRRIRRLPTGLRLLDVGAAGGHLGRSVRDRCAFLAGIESDPGVPESSKEGYDHWLTSDALVAEGWGERFDVVVCADVLEHVASPEDLLVRVRSWLKPGGVLLASVPNVANISLRLALLFGRFPYAERGLLDRSHLRFYTRATARRLLEAQGFRIRSVRATSMPYELAFPTLARPPLVGAIRGVARMTARVSPTVFGYQFVFEAVSP